MRKALVPAATTVVWAVVTYAVAAWRSLAREGVGGGEPGADDAVALLLLVVTGASVLLLGLWAWRRSRAVVVALWALCGAAVTLGATLVVLAFVG